MGGCSEMTVLGLGSSLLVIIIIIIKKCSTSDIRTYASKCLYVTVSAKTSLVCTKI